MAGEDQLLLLQVMLRSMKQQLSTVCTDVEELKHSWPLERVAQLPILVRYKIPWYKVSFLRQSSVLMVSMTALLLWVWRRANRWKVMAAECSKSAKSADQVSVYCSVFLQGVLISDSNLAVTVIATHALKWCQTSLQRKPDRWILSFTRILSQLLHSKWF